MSELFASMQDSRHLVDISERQAFVTEEIKEEMEDGVIPPSQKAMVLRYIKATNFGMYVTGTSLFLLGVFIPHFDIEDYLRAEPIILFVLVGILLSFGAVQIYRSFKTEKPHYMLSGVLSFLLGVGYVLFVLTDLSWVTKYYILAVTTAMWNLQYCQDWDFRIMIDRFLRQIRSESNEYRMRARTGEEVLTQPALGSLLSFLELKWIFGCTTHKSRERLDLEEETHEMWGNYILKDRPGNAGRAHGAEEFASTEDQLISAYRFAVDDGKEVPYKGPEDPRFRRGFESLSGFNWLISFMEGVTTQLSWLTSLAFAGLETGNVLFDAGSPSSTPRIMAIILSVLTMMAYLANIYQAQNMMGTCLGLPVAEREWLAIDWMDRITDKKLLRAQAQDGTDHRRMNLTYFWLCASAVADAWGAGIICKLASNCALMTKEMFEAVTSFEFIGYNKAKYALMIWGNVINGVQIFFLSMMTVLWFGSYGIETSGDVFWAGYVLCVCLLGSGLRIKEAAKMWMSMEAKRNAQNYLFGVMLVAFMGCMLVLTTCLIPILVGNGNLFGSCQNSPLYEDLFPHLCSEAAKENQAAYWIVVGSSCLGIGLTIGAFFFGSPNVIVERH